MNEPRLSERELLILIEGACDTTLSQADFNRLARALRDDASSRELYRAYMQMDIDLYWRQIGATDSLPWSKTDKANSHGPIVLSLGDSQELGSIVTPSAMDFPGAELTSFESHAAKSSSHTDNHRAHRKPRRTSGRDRLGANRWMQEAAYRLVGTFVFCAILMIIVSPYLTSRFGGKDGGSAEKLKERRLAISGEAVATLVSTVDCRWQHASLKEGSSVGPEELELLSGTAEFLFRDGARVVLEGPAIFTTQSAGHAALEYGKLAVQVPKRAIGFTITTPTAEVVDFGTEFGVAVSKEGIVDVAVLIGKVEVSSLKPPLNSNQRAENENKIVTAGQAVTARRTSNRLAIDVTNYDDVMAASLAKPFAVMASMPNKVVAYQFPDRTAGNRRDFHGGVGLDFEVRVPIRIFSLGVFDHLGDGIDPATSPTVQLWSRDTKGTPDDPSDDVGGEMLASEVFTAGDISELKLGHRFKPLPKPIELPIGSYSIVAYDLADGNAFVSNKAGSSEPNRGTFNGGLGRSPFSGSITIVGNDAVVAGHVGGTFARNDNESYYGDTKLRQLYTLDSSISAAGVFTVSDPETMAGKFFVGHFSSSVDDNRREFLGMEFEEGDLDAYIGVRARIYRFDGSSVDDTKSGTVNLSNSSGPYYFDYTYDPNYEADAGHPGPEGRVALHVYNATDTFNSTLYAVNDSSHRDAGSTFDSFGMGIGTQVSLTGDDPTATAKVFMDDVTYSGHEGVVNFNTDPGWKGLGNTSDGNNYGWIQHTGSLAAKKSNKSTVRGQIESWSGSIVPVGSRFGDCKPGAFPVTLRDRKISYGAASFEYIPQRKPGTEINEQ